MDAGSFDHLTRHLAAPGARRAVLRMLAALPLAGGLAALFAEDDVEAAGRRMRRKKRHKHGRGRRRRRKRRTCRAKSRAKTCAGRCGIIKNNCRKKVNCGPCLCDPACPVCQICDEVAGQCMPDPEQQGDQCGDPGQVCQADGACACDAESCQNPTPICATDGRCVACSASDLCPDGGCCDNGACIDNGAPCDDGDRCTTNDTCREGTCGGSPVVCDDPSACQTGPGACDPQTGDCVYPKQPDGTRCGDKCTQACSEGVCGAGTPVGCEANVCQVAGTCDPSSGTCSPPTNKPSGSDCSSAVPCGRCDGNGSCVGCTGTDCCGTDGECHGDGEPCRPGETGFCCNRQCTCFFGGFCRISEGGETCCCTGEDQICVDTDNGGSCD